ncbi:MAG: hypothetical protein HYV42_05115 [Candidatus Magasanikbacteria bacterium]|nr:hypothetical protein [Candidatus Magasanikbacteria bacterium]
MDTRILSIVAAFVCFPISANSVTVCDSEMLNQPPREAVFLSIGVCTAILDEALAPCPDKAELIQQCCQDQRGEMRHACVIGHLTPAALARLGERLAMSQEKARLERRFGRTLIIVTVFLAVVAIGMGIAVNQLANRRPGGS